MLLAFAVLLIHPQIVAVTPPNPDAILNDTSAAASASNSDMETETPVPAAPASSVAKTQPAIEATAELPAAPMPLVATFTTPASKLLFKPGSAMIVSVKDLRTENHRKLMLWRGLAIASSGAATFDAATTRYTITRSGAQELDPLLKPFAGNSSLFVAVQVAPALLDFAGRKMMYSRHSLLRNTWWVPQSASFVVSMFCGAHNLAYH